MKAEQTQAVKTDSKRGRWYNSYQFPLIPCVETRKKDQYNASSFSFHWLFIRIWSLDHFSFELALVASSHWGIGVTAILPYLRIVLCIPPPVVIYKLDNFLKRKP